MLEFEIQVGKFAEKINTNLATVIRRIGLDLFGRVVKRTPVRTGYLRRNWQLTTDAPAESVVGPQPPEPTSKAALAALNPLAPPDPPTNLNPSAVSVWLCNNVVYAEPIENGHSKQAPQGMLRISLAEVQAEIDTITGGLP